MLNESVLWPLYDRLGSYHGRKISFSITEYRRRRLCDSRVVSVFAGRGRAAICSRQPVYIGVS